MYRLYGNIAGWKNLDISENEKDIIDTLKDYVYQSKAIEYMIIEQRDNTDFPYKQISTLQDYFDYINEYEDKKTLKLQK
jgi:hypothetical protein